VTLSNFGGDLSSSKVTGLVLDTIPGYIDSSRVNNLPSIPTLSNYKTQSQVQLSSFGGNIPYNRVSGIPEQEYIANVLLVDNQADLLLSNFGGSLPSSRVTNLPTPE
jgi:hypothetical protein